MDKFFTFFSFSYKDKTYDSFAVHERIIDMKMSGDELRTIAVPHISSISIIRKRQGYLSFLAIAGMLLFLYGVASSGAVYMIAGAGAIAAIFFIPPKWYLAISTNDGVFNLFEGNYEFLRQVKGKLDEIINSGRVGSQFNVNFTADKITEINIGDHISNK